MYTKNSGSTGVEHSTTDPEVNSSSLVVPYFIGSPSSGNTVVKHLATDPEVKGLNPDTTQHQVK